MRYYSNRSEIFRQFFMLSTIFVVVHHNRYIKIVVSLIGALNMDNWYVSWSNDHSWTLPIDLITVFLMDLNLCVFNLDVRNRTSALNPWNLRVSKRVVLVEKITIHHKFDKVFVVFFQPSHFAGIFIVSICT